MYLLLQQPSYRINIRIKMGQTDGLILIDRQTDTLHFHCGLGHASIIKEVIVVVGELNWLQTESVFCRAVVRTCLPSASITSMDLERLATLRRDRHRIVLNSATRDMQCLIRMTNSLVNSALS